MTRQEETEQRVEYACFVLDTNEIDYKVTNTSIGQINLLKNKKTVISFYAYTGAIWCKEFNIKKDDLRGIKNCVLLYNEKYKEIK